MTARSIIIPLAIIGLSLVFVTGQARTEPQRLPLLSTIELTADAVPGHWRPMPGLRVDDLEELGSIPIAQRATVEAIRNQLVPLGIESTADYSLFSTGTPSNVVTVRVFAFTTEEQCHAFFAKKYLSDAAAPLYRKVESPNSTLILDSVQVNKRIYRAGRVWITSHQLGSGTEHIAAAEHLLEQLTGQ